MTLLLSTLLPLVACSASATETEASECVTTKVWDSYADGWRVRTQVAETLAPGANANHLVTLYAGNTYEVKACGDASVADLDILIYDTEGAIVARDESTDRQPSVRYTPSATRTYYVVTYLRDASAEAGVAMAVVYK